MAGPRYGRLLTDLTVNGLGLNPGTTANEGGDFIILGTNSSGEQIVIYVGNVTDGSASGFAPGSIALDTTDGLLMVADSDGKWQVVTV